MSSYRIGRLHRDADESRLQELLERCSDYYLLHEDWPTPKDAAAYELSAVPDGRSAADLHVFGMATATGELIAVAHFLRDHPVQGDWWLGLLLVAPSLRGQGVGSQLFEHVLEVVRAAGGRSLHLAVSLKNPRARKFWEGAGFVDTHQLLRVAARSGHVEDVQVLSRDLHVA
jgi:GNAT superfamily N-acetyltransferase